MLRPVPEGRRIELPGPVGFVLGGGAGYGAVQVGMLRALDEVGLRPDLVVGTSVGALNGAVLAHDPQAAVDRLTTIWPTITTDVIFPKGWVTRLRTLQNAKGWLSDNAELRRVLDVHMPVLDFEDLSKPFGAVVTDFDTGQPITITSGPLRPAVLASAAIPGVFPPVEHEGRVLVDGGMVANVPVRQALQLGARSLVILDCGLWGLSDSQPSTLVETMLRVAAMTVRRQLVVDLPAALEQVPVVFLPGPFPMPGSPLEFGRSSKLISLGYASAKPFLSVLQVDGPGLYGAPPMLG